MMKGINIYNIENIYRIPNLDIFDEPLDEYYLKILKILNDTNIISKEHYRIFVLYCELGSSRKVAEHCHLKYRRIAYIINKIKKIIKKELCTKN